MRPALQRLLSRPSSLEFLRTLVATPVANPSRYAPRKRGRQRSGHETEERRHVSSAAALKQEEYQESTADVETKERLLWSTSTITTHEPRTNSLGRGVIQGATSKPSQSGPSMNLKPDEIWPDEIVSDSNDAEVQKIVSLLPWTGLDIEPSTHFPIIRSSYRPHSNRRAENPFGPWSNMFWTRERLDYESDLSSPMREGQRRLLQSTGHQSDPRLWAYLLEYRRLVYGLPGVLMFWKEIQKRPLLLPTKTSLADKMWPTLLALGFHDPVILDQICFYAFNRLEEAKTWWSGLYVSIVEHFLLTGDGKAAVQWHKRLYGCCPPGSHRFARMCSKVAHRQGDLATLWNIYHRCDFKNVYRQVVPTLCAQEDYKTAIQWHYGLFEHEDFPSNAKDVEPLVHFLAIYYPSQARKLTRSLVEANIPFASALSARFEEEEKIKISREMMNLAHGETLGVAPKKYNDSLGARWFATNWVSLDTAIATIQALGVQEIGPLSLQAIALREPDPKSIVRRLNLLKDLGISIGKSMFSRAVEHFARNRNYVHLEGLLNSDQHPDEFEDAALQEVLLSSYAQARDWAQYRRTLAILALGSRSPLIEESNVILRSLIIRGSQSAIFTQLEDMQLKGTPVKLKTISLLIRTILMPRMVGRRPVTLQRTQRAVVDLNTAIVTMKRIMHSGSYIPVTHWREIVRRLGMLGRFKDVCNLCHYLARWYGPATQGAGFNSRNRRYRVPIQVPTSHSLHPLRILFNNSMQSALVEWGFIYAKKQTTAEAAKMGLRTLSESTLPDITSGIRLVKELNQLGVHIDGPVVHKAILNRLITYYGPGRSSRAYNRVRKELLVGKMDEVMSVVDQALGGEFFSSPRVELKSLLHQKALVRIKRATKVRWRHRFKLSRTRDTKLLYGDKILSKTHHPSIRP